MSAQLSVRVTPKAGRDEVAGLRDDELQVKVTAAAEGGKANAAVCALLAKALHVPKTSVRVIRGETARHKRIEFGTLEAGELAERLAAAFGRGDGAQ